MRVGWMRLIAAVLLIGVLAGCTPGGGKAARTSEAEEVVKRRAVAFVEAIFGKNEAAAMDMVTPYQEIMVAQQLHAFRNQEAEFNGTVALVGEPEIDTVVFNANETKAEVVVTFRYTIGEYIDFKESYLMELYDYDADGVWLIGRVKNLSHVDMKATN